MTFLLIINAFLLALLAIKVERSIHYILEAENDDSNFNDWNFER